MGKIKIKCRNNNCLRKGDFSETNGICPKCWEIINNPVKKKNKPIAKKSKNSYPKALAKAKAAFQKLRRAQEADSNGVCHCVNGEYRNWDACDGGHYFPANCIGSCFDPRNVHPQAKTSNQRMDHPDINGGYTKYMETRYGNHVIEELRMLSKKTMKGVYDAFTLNEMANEYEREFEKVVKEKGLKVKSKVKG